MQGQESQNANVISLFGKRNQKAEEAEAAKAPTDEAKAESDESFEDVMRRNAQNKARVEKERASANKSVLRSYRIKH